MAAMLMWPVDGAAVAEDFYVICCAVISREAVVCGSIHDGRVARKQGALQSLRLIYGDLLQLRHILPLTSMAPWFILPSVKEENPMPETTNAPTTAAPEMVETHPFAHLGPAPYSFVGTFTMPSPSLLEANPTAYNNALAYAPRLSSGLGSCAHCSTPISNVFIIECSDGSRHGVGCDCIFKLNQSPKLVSAVKREHSRMTAQRAKVTRHAREAAQLAENAEWFVAHETELSAFPHPQEWRAAKGETYADMIRWYLKNAGTTGKLSIIKAAKAKLAQFAA